MLNELVGECRLLVEALPSPHAHSLLEVDRGTRERKKGASERRKRERKGRERERQRREREGNESASAHTQLRRMQ